MLGTSWSFCYMQAFHLLNQNRSHGLQSTSIASIGPSGVYPIGRNGSSGKALHLPSMVLSGPFLLPLPAFNVQ